jgi:hypothetical protein
MIVMYRFLSTLHTVTTSSCIRLDLDFAGLQIWGREEFQFKSGRGQLQFEVHTPFVLL